MHVYTHTPVRKYEIWTREIPSRTCWRDARLKYYGVVIYRLKRVPFIHITCLYMSSLHTHIVPLYMSSLHTHTLLIYTHTHYTYLNCIGPSIFFKESRMDSEKPLCALKPARYNYTHTHTHTLSLSEVYGGTENFWKKPCGFCTIYIFMYIYKHIYIYIYV